MQAQRVMYSRELAMELAVSQPPGEPVPSQSSPARGGQERGQPQASALRQRKANPAEAGDSQAGEGQDVDTRHRWHGRAVRVSCVLLLLLSLDLVFSALQLEKLKAAFSGLERAPAPKAKQPPLAVTDASIRAACNSREQTELHHFLHNIVLIINTNYEDAARSTSEFLRNVYGKFFDNIVILSREDIPDLKVQARGHKKWRKDWMFAYFHLPNVMAAYPNAEGFLWTNDDVAINYWHLRHANKSRLWLPNNMSDPDVKFFPFDQKTPSAHFDFWAGNKEFRDASWKAYEAMDDNYQVAYKRNLLPLKDVYPKRIVDTFYIPRRLVQGFAFDLIPVFRENGIWSEIGVPMIFYALDSPANFDAVLNDMVTVEDRSNYDPAQRWSPHISALHPFKLSKNESKAQYLKLLGSVDLCLLRLLPTVLPAQKWKY